jgi:DNA adenine methylase
MQYLGGKAKLAKKILPLVLAGREPGQFYVEPFLGGLNVLPHVDGPRVGSDIRADLIALYRHLQDGWAPPPSLSEEEYRAIRARPEDHHPALEAFAAYGCSFGGRRWGGYARGAEGRDYANGTRNGLLRIAGKLQGVRLECAGYDQLHIPGRSIVYCDPPYAGTTGYGGGAFGHDEFWSWAHRMAGDGHSVFVSEYTAPPEWRCVWEHEHFNSVRKKGSGPKPVERLFTL